MSERPALRRPARSIALVTGGARGIGRSTALKLGAPDCAVAVVDIDSTAALETVGLLRARGVRTQFFEADVADAARLANAVRAAEADLGPVAVLAHVAGIQNQPTRVRDLDLATWQQVIQVNLSGAFHAMQAVIPGMVSRGWGRIVVVSSALALRGRPGTAAYASSKGALLGLVKSLALEVANRGVTVNAVLPAMVDTAMPRQFATDAQLHARGAEIPSGRIAHPDEVAALIAFLAGQDAAYITGDSIPLAGGSIVWP